MGKLILKRPTYREVTALFQFTLAVDSISVQLKCQEESGQFELHSVFDMDPDILDMKGWREFKVPFHLDPGKTFELQVCGMLIRTLKGGIIADECVEEMSEEFRSVHTRADLQELQRRAVNHMRKKGNRETECSYMSRNKLRSYYDDILDDNNGIMETYIKDNNGDPASVINGTIHGLFFATKPPAKSNFGPRRLLVPADLLVNDEYNLYFADFYCNYQAHYVTLVSCQDGSVEDNFCRKKLLSLDSLKNPFLRIAEDGSVWVTNGVLVEVLRTEDIDINSFLEQGAKFKTVPSRGTSKPAGIPKNKKCTICNL